MKITSTIREHLKELIGAEADDREIEFYKQLICSLAANVSYGDYGDTSECIIHQADSIINLLLTKRDPEINSG